MHSSDLKAASKMVETGRKYRAVSMAGYNGSVNVWRGDDGLWYGAFGVYRICTLLIVNMGDGTAVALLAFKCFDRDRFAAATWLRKQYRRCQ
jgi:hypothetical protein